jgi:hypothetical protein
MHKGQERGIKPQRKPHFPVFHPIKSKVVLFAEKQWWRIGRGMRRQDFLQDVTPRGLQREIEGLS